MMHLLFKDVPSGADLSMRATQPTAIEQTMTMMAADATALSNDSMDTRLYKGFN